MNRLYHKFAVLLITWVLSAPTVVYGQKERYPNVLLIMTDQQAWNAVGYSGNKKIKTPNLDRLAREGVNFSQAITPCPVCVPARTSILTGRLTETTTIRENNDVKAGECYYPTFDEILAKRGFTTEVYGKYHSPEHMARVYMNPPVNGLTGTDPIVRWESIYVKYIQEHFKKRALKPGEMYETTFYGGVIPYKLDPIDRYYKYLPTGIVPEEELNQELSQADVHGTLDLPVDHTITAVQGRQTVAALERLKNKQFILTCSFHCPHVPITPSEPYASMYKAKDMVTPVSIQDSREN